MHEHDEHTHSHDIQNLEETVAALRYMLRHNEHHADELHALAHDLEHLGLPEQAAEAELAVRDYESGNARLKNALDAIGE